MVTLRRSYPAGLNLVTDLNLRSMIMVMYDQLADLQQKAAEPVVTAEEIATIKSQIASLQTAVSDIRSLSYRDFGEIADPLGPGKDSARLYARDNASGKTQLVVRFPTGAVQVLATEP